MVLPCRRFKLRPSVHHQVSHDLGLACSCSSTVVRFINADTDALLLCGFNDGVVRLWRDWKTEAPVVSTAWRAGTDSRSCGMAIAPSLF
jgi:hypothetical protein